jgi:hypothetical protein
VLWLDRWLLSKRLEREEPPDGNLLRGPRKLELLVIPIVLGERLATGDWRYKATIFQSTSSLRLTWGTVAPQF